MPAANEKPRVLPSPASASIMRSRPLSVVQQTFHPGPDVRDELLPVVDTQPSRRNGLSKRYADRHRLDPWTSLPHGVAGALDGNRDDGRLGLEGHDETALLERQQLARPAAGALGEYQ